MDNYYFKSTDVKVFPCSYRGAYSETAIFDPESRATSEYNITHIGKINNVKDSYIVAHTTNNNLKCVIGGYYFEIVNFALDDLKSIIGFSGAAENKEWYLCIKTSDVTLKAADGTDVKRTTKVLDSYINATAVDSNVGTETSPDWRFTCLVLCDTIPNETMHTLPILIKKGTGSTATLKLYNDSFEPIISRGTEYANNIIIGGSDTLSGVNIVTHKNIATGLDTFASGSDTTASGDYAASFGKGTIADKEAMIAVGKYNVSEDGDLLVVGNGTSTTKSNVVQVNNNKVVINKQTNITGDTSITGNTNITGDTAITGNETLSGNLTINTNKFKVNATDGKVEAAGSLEIASDKFKVDATNGNTEVAGTFTQKSGQVEFSGNVDAKSGLDVAGTFTVSGTSNNFNVTESGELVSKGKIILGETNGEVILSKADKETEIKGSLKVDQTANIVGNVTINTDKISITASNGNILSKGGVTINGTLVQEGQVDIGQTATDTTGTNARSAVKIGKSGQTTEILGKLKIDSDLSLENAFEIKNKIGQETATSTKFKIETDGDVSFKGNLTMDNNQIATLPSAENVYFDTLNLKAMLIDSLYPIGSIYTSTERNNATISVTGKEGCRLADFGGTWERIKGRFLWAAEESEVVETTGGNKNAVLITHYHNINIKNGGNHTHDTSSTTTKDGESTTKKLTGNCWFIEAEDDSHLIEDCNGIIEAPREPRKSGTNKFLDQSSKGGDGFRFKIDATHGHKVASAGAHTHTVEQQYATKKVTDSEVIYKNTEVEYSETGEGKNMPPYLVVYMWKRTA